MALTADAHLEFVDAESLDAVRWPELWRAFAPVTPGGRRTRDEWTPFLPGDEHAWLEALAQLEKDRTQWSPETIVSARRALAALPDVEAALAALAAFDGALASRSLLVLKQFAFLGQQLSTASAWPAGAWTRSVAWSVLLAPFGEVRTPTFSVDHLADEAYRAAAHDWLALVKQATAAQQARDAAWTYDLGIRPQRDGLLVLPLPHHRADATRLRADARLRWLRDTPYERVFELLPTAEQAALAVAQERVKARLDAASDKALQDLCRRLRAVLSMWYDAVADVTQIDLRLAKVELAQRWQACVPTWAGEVAGDADVVQVPDMHLKGAVHPLVAAAVAASGGVYVPLDIDPMAGANVLLGSNMGGKTVALSLLFLCQWLAQMGLPVPAQSFRTRLFYRLRFCAAADIGQARGLSSFGQEVARLSSVWRAVAANAPALVCFDEPARSTNPVEGEALAAGLLGVAAAAGAHGTVALMATHYTGAARVSGTRRFLVQGLKQQPGDAYLRDGNGDVDDLAVRLRWLGEAMDYQVVRVGQAEVPHEALAVARWLGLPAQIAARSEQFLRGDNSDE